MRPICAILDADDADKAYSQALSAQEAIVENPDLTASARMLAGMRQTDQPFSRFALAKSAEHAECFKHHKSDESFCKQFQEMAQQSLVKQVELETRQQPPFDEFLKQYFAQK